MARTDRPPSSEGPLQFGRRRVGEDYKDRPTAHGVAVREDGRVACVKVADGSGPPYFDLPGGGLDPGETHEAALAREFGEETGLVVDAGRLLVVCSQYMHQESGAPANNHGRLFEARVRDFNPRLKVEASHELVWLEPLDAVTALRHDSHSFAVSAWLRLGQERASDD